MTVPTLSGSHAEHDLLLIAQLADGDVTSAERVAGQRQADDCADCALLLADLRAIARATAALPEPKRTRDFRLTDADAARLRPGGIRGFLGWLGSPRLAFVKPLGSGLAALGVAGLLIASLPSTFFTTASGPSREVVAPAGGSGSTAGQTADQAGTAAPVSGTTAQPTAFAAPNAAGGGAPVTTDGSTGAAGQAPVQTAAPIAAPTAAPIALATPGPNSLALPVATASPVPPLPRPTLASHGVGLSGAASPSEDTVPKIAQASGTIAEASPVPQATDASGAGGVSTGTAGQTDNSGGGGTSGGVPVGASPVESSGSGTISDQSTTTAAPQSPPGIGFGVVGSPAASGGQTTTDGSRVGVGAGASAESGAGASPQAGASAEAAVPNSTTASSGTAIPPLAIISLVLLVAGAALLIGRLLGTRASRA